MNRACRFVSVLLAIVVMAGVAAAQPRTMTAVDLLSVPTQSDVRVAPHGGAVLFVRTQTDWDQDKSISHIWRVDDKGLGLVQMTNGKSGESSPRWSPDGTRFCFVATREGETAQLFVQPICGGEAIQVSKHESSVSDPQWLPDGTHILFVAEDTEGKEAKPEYARQGGHIRDRNRHLRE